MRQRRIWVSILVGVLVLIGLGAGAFLIWASNPYEAMPEALASLESDEYVEVSTDPWLMFVPVGKNPQTGFIFYPGGLVEAEAYAPAARTIAEKGYLVVITPMPLNLAFFNSDAAADVITAHTEIENWAIGGHSLGGSMAASYADLEASQIDGLVLWASYPADSNDFSEQDIAAASIYGTLDGAATPEEVLAAKTLLPPDTEWVPIDGGNHAQFGWYGQQKGDNPATISREEQQEKAVTATLALLSALESTDE
jgi:pimeloyl-ACP methyl ester carboxylesterase